MKRYSSVTLHESPKHPNSREKIKSTSTKFQISIQKNFPEWFGQKQIEALRFWNRFHDKSGQTDCSKEMLFLTPERAQTSEHCFNKDHQRMMVDPMFMIVQSLMSFLTAVTTTAVAPTAVILPEFTWFTWIYLNLPECTWIYLNLTEFT